MTPLPLPHAYVLVTPARNEAHNLHGLIATVSAQIVLPAEWIVVDDGSVDDTPHIVAEAADVCPFLRLVQLPRREGERSFGRKALAFAHAVEKLTTPNYQFIGNLDADITLEPDYYARVLETMRRDPTIGLAGGSVHTRVRGRQVCLDETLGSVAGAIQFFRRACFEDIGGYPVLPFGGIDAAAELAAKARGWRVLKLLDLRVLEHRQTGTAEANALRAKYNEGRRFHSLGYGLGWFAIRCVHRIMDPPRAIGSIAAYCGYVSGVLRGQSVLIPKQSVDYWRREHRDRLVGSPSRLWKRLTRGAHEV